MKNNDPRSKSEKTIPVCNLKLKEVGQNYMKDRFRSALLSEQHRQVEWSILQDAMMFLAEYGQKFHVWF